MNITAADATVSAIEPDNRSSRRFPIGAEVCAGGVDFRVWAPRRRSLEVVFQNKQLTVDLCGEPEGYFQGLIAGAEPGDLYRFRLDGEDPLYPDPASRFQPEGPHGPSMIIEPRAYEWQDQKWRGVSSAGQIIYEMHVGTFTPAGNWQEAARRLPLLGELGVTVLEIMPVADFAGRYGWGYDGVNFFAPSRLYGTPDDFRAFVDQAHGLHVAVILDVVYNHAGPDGNYLHCFSQDYFTQRYRTEWGDPFNFDGENAGPVRDFFLTNAAYWIEEFHLDGLRLDATQNIYDSSARHILAEVSARARAAAGGRKILIIAENEPQNAQLVRSTEERGYGMDAIWNDDFHHAAVVALTGHNEAYYSDYRGSAGEFVAAAKRGFLYQGQFYAWQNQRRGTPTWGIPPSAFVNYLENHDQIANMGRGHRVHQNSHPRAYRALTALLLLGPQTPLLFQGQEFCATTPFVFFSDHKPELNALVKEGRIEFLSQFPSLSYMPMQATLPDPTDPEAFAACRLQDSERAERRAATELHRDLIWLRRKDSVFGTPRLNGVDGAVLDDQTFVLRFFAADGNDRLMMVSLGIDKRFAPVPEPLLAPPPQTEWRILWSSENPKYGGSGALPIETSQSWFIPGRAAFVLKPERP